MSKSTTIVGMVTIVIIILSLTIESAGPLFPLAIPILIFSWTILYHREKSIKNKKLED